MLKLTKLRNRIVARFKVQGVIPMPRSMPLNWSDNGIRADIKPSGLQKIPLFKYLSGTYLRLKASFSNDSEYTKEISYNCTLFRLSGTKEPADPMHQIRDSFELKPKSTEVKKWDLCYLPTQGNYVVKLDLKSNGETSKTISQDVIYFDALPRDRTLLNLQNVIIVGIIMLIIGGLLGKFVFS